MDTRKHKGIAQYRCSRCTLVEMDSEGPIIGSEVLKAFAVNHALEAYRDDHGVVTERGGVHNCPDGSAGIMYIIGIFPEADVPAVREHLKKLKEQAHEEQAKRPPSSSSN